MILETVTGTNQHLFVGGLPEQGSLETALANYKASQISRIVLLCPANECMQKTGTSLLSELKHNGLKVTFFPLIANRQPARSMGYEQMTARIARKCLKDKNILVLSDGDIRSQDFKNQVREKMLSISLAQELRPAIKAPQIKRPPAKAPVKQEIPAPLTIKTHSIAWQTIKYVPDTNETVFRTHMPGRYAIKTRRKESVKDAIAEFKRREISTIVLLCSDKECQDKIGIDLKQCYLTEGFKVIHHPLQDKAIFPEQSAGYDQAIDQIYSDYMEGKKILIHCSAGIERTGTVVASLHSKITGLSFAASRMKVDPKRNNFYR